MVYVMKEIKRFDLPYRKINFSVDSYEIERTNLDVISLGIVFCHHQNGF